MTEAQWLACTDPTPMLEYLHGSERNKEHRLRRFLSNVAIACGL
jgi:hypothetical protein